MTRSALLAAAAALLWLTAPPVHAQHPEIRVGQTLAGRLDSDDPLPSQRGRFEVYQFDGRAGERLTVTMRSDAFDAYLRLARTLGGITDELDFDDDGGGGTHARLRVVLPATGTFLLVAQALDEAGSGGYEITLEATPEPTTDLPHPLALGETVTGALEETDAVDEADDTYYDRWTVEAAAGDRLVATMESGAYDAYLSFGRLDADGLFEPIESDDDGGGGTNALLRVRVPNTGSYELRANSITPATGPYALTLAEGVPPAETAERRPIQLGDPAAGELTADDALLADDTHHDYWLYEGRAGERLTVRMESGEFDTFLAVGVLNGEIFEEIDSNDDGPYGTDSQLEVTLAEDGSYAIRTSSLGPGETGAYRIEVTRR